MFFAVFGVYAQSSGDKLYNQGLQLQKTMTIAAQNSAIAKFTSAKKLYDSAAKKAQCDQAIGVSRNIISTIKGGGSGKSSKTQKTVEVVEVKVEPKLNVNPSEFSVDLTSKTLNVNVDTNLEDWTVSPISNSDGSSFLKVNKLGANSFEITMPQNPSSIIREQKVLVSAGDLTREVTVRQEGKPIDLSVSKNYIEFPKKGGEKKIDVLCNSDYEYANNSNFNWEVESAPDWIIVASEPKKTGGLGGLLQKGKDLVSGTNNRDTDESMQKFTLKLTAKPHSPASAERTTGRKGEIVLKSGDKRVTVSLFHLGDQGKVQ